MHQHQWNVKNFAEHTSRIELGVILASLAEVAQTRTNESEKVSMMVGADLRVLVMPTSGEGW